MPLSDEQMARRRATNARILRVLSIPFLVLGLFILFGTSAWWLGLLFALVGVFMGLTWFPRFQPRPPVNGQ